MFKSLNEIINNVNHTGSPIEKMIYNELISYGLKPIPQYPIGVFFIDLAFPEIKLAIEADGKEYHSNKEQKERDLYRQKRIESLGWVFERFSGTFINRNKEVIAAKIALKYFKDKITKEQEKRAIGFVAKFLTKKDIDLTINIVNAYLDGYILKNIERKRKY